MKRLNLLLVTLLISSFAIGQALSESFETWPPVGWTIVQGPCTPTNDITQNSDQAHSGTYSARFSSFSSCGDGYDEYMITPKLNTTSGDQTFSFWYRKYSSGSETFQVGWSSTGTDVTTDFTWGPEISDASTTWQQYVKTDLPVGTMYVAIHYYSDFAYYLYIDDVAGPELVSVATGTLSGTVTDSESGDPIEGALVTTNPSAKETTYTNASGEYELELEVGMYDVTVTKNYYEPGEALGVVISEGENTVQDFALEPIPQEPGTNCEYSYPLTDAMMPFSATGMTTCGFGDDYSSADACESSYMNGDDFVFEYTPTDDVLISVTLSETGTYTGVFIIEGCPDVGACVSYNLQSSGNPYLDEIELTGGTTYFIIVSTWPSPQCTDFDIVITTEEPPVYGFLNGTVTANDTGDPIEGALITITPAPFKETTYTNASGYYEQELETGYYTVTVDYPGYVADTLEDVLITEGVTTTVDFGLDPIPPYPLPFYEAWDEGSFDFQNWSFVPSQGNWGITTSPSYGNPVPAARFYWSPGATDYAYRLESWDIDGTSKADDIYVSFDLYLSNYSTSTLEQLDFVIFDGTDYIVINTWDNQNGSIDWGNHGYLISNYVAGKIFRIGFRAYGENSFNINGWAIDNIQIIEGLGDLEGVVANTHTAEPVPNATVTVSDATDAEWIVNTNDDGEFFVGDLPPGTYDVYTTADDFYPTLLEDVLVNPAVTTNIAVPLEPIAPVLLTAQYNDQQVSLTWEKKPGTKGSDNISGTTIEVNTEMYEPGETLDLDLSFIYNSADFEFICGFFMDFPDGIVVNSATDLDGGVGSSYLSYNGETGDGATCTWGVPAGNCGYGTLYSSGDFSVNITIPEDYLGMIEIPFTIYGDGFGNPVHEISGVAELPTYEFNIYRDGAYLTTVMGFHHTDEGLTNGQEYCYYVTQILPDKAESQPSNTLCATPNLPPEIEVTPDSFYEVMNPDMIVTRTMSITNTTEGPLYLDFLITSTNGTPPKSSSQPEWLSPEPPSNTTQIDEIKTDPSSGNMASSDAEIILQYDTGNNANALGLVGGGDFFVGAFWPAVSLNPYIDFEITEVEVFINDIGAINFELMIWDENSNIMYQQPFIPPAVGWYTVVLDTPLTIDGTEGLIVGYSIVGSVDGEHPAGMDEGPVVAGFGDLISFDGATWNTLSGYGINRNFNIHTKIVGEFTTWNVTTDPIIGTVAPGETFDVNVIFNSTGYDAGYYTDELHIFSNDLNNPEVIIPVAMEIFQPSVSVEPGLHSNTLTMTPMPENKGTENIENCYIECQSPSYTAGVTMDLNFYLYYYAPDYEFLDGVGITFPTGVTVNSAGNCGSMLYNGETGDGVQVTWGDITGGSQWGPVNSDQYFSVNVTIDPGFTGDIDMDWLIAGDFYGGGPHFAFGTTSVSQYVPFETSYNVYRDDILIAENVGEVYVDHPLDSHVEYCYTVTQNCLGIPPSAHSEPACGIPYTYGDKCDLAYEYAVVDDPTVFGSTTYTGDYVWYSVENPVTQDFVVSLCGSDYDTKVAVYASCDDWDGNFPVWYDLHGALVYNDDNDVCYSGMYSYQSLTHLNWAQPGMYYVLIWGWGGEFGNYELNIYSEQAQRTMIGWHGFSSYANMETKASMEDVFADVLPQLTILINEEGIFWPGQNINTIGDFNTYEGHKVKWNDETTWIADGEIVEDRTVTFSAGTHFLPVLNVTPVPVDGFITELDQIEFMFDIDNMLIYWPEGGIVPGMQGALDYLFPGSAYLFKCNDEVTFDFTPYAPTDNNTVTIPPEYFSTLENNTTWNDVLKTGDQHFVAISQSALNKLEPGDYIGAFNSEGICTGLQYYSGKETALVLAVNSDDFTTKDVDGMLNQEFINYRIYRDGQIYEAVAVYNADMPNFDGLFNINGLSQIVEFKFGSTSIEEDPMSGIMIYPNPSTGIFNIDIRGIENTLKMEVLNSRGQLIYTTELNGSDILDLSAQPRGVYFIRLINSSSVELKKVVIK